MSTVTDVNVWQYARILGVPTPGTIPRGGIKGFDRETGWDVKKGKGVQGATLTLISQPPCEGSILLQLIGPGGFYADGQASTDFAQWDQFVSLVLMQSPASQKASGLAIFHPQLQSIGINAVVVQKFSGPMHVGKGLYHATIHLIEWTPPPKVNITSTPASVAPDKDANGQGPPKQSPRNQALLDQISALQKAATP